VDEGILPRVLLTDEGLAREVVVVIWEGTRLDNVGGLVKRAFTTMEGGVS